MAPQTAAATPVALTKAKVRPDIIDVPARLTLTLAGAGAPADPAFTAAIGALYGIAYTLRFARKAAGREVFKVGPLEGEWRVEGEVGPDGGVPAPDRWRWRLRIGVPPDVTEEELQSTIDAATAKRKSRLEGSELARRVALEEVAPGRHARILHVGPYATEPESFARIDQLVAAEGLTREPWHIEVYLSDPGRTPPEKLRTVLLTPVHGPGGSP